MRVLFRNPEKDLPIFLLRQVGFCTVFLTFHNITYNAVKQILIVYTFFMSLNESVKETNSFFDTPWSFCNILLIFISSLFNFLDYKKGYVTYIL